MKGWEVRELGEVCKVIAGQSPEGKHYNDGGEGLPFYQGKKDFGDKFIQSPRVWTSEVTKEAEAGDILMSVRAPVGPINFSTTRICIGRGLAAIRALKSIDREFLFYMLLSKQGEISGNEGAVFASINRSQIEAIKMSVPAKPEQRRIIAILDEAFAGLEAMRVNAEKNLQNARELFDNYLNAIFTQKGEGWVEKTLGQLAEFKNGLNFTKSSKGEVIRIVGVKDFQNFFWIPTEGLDEAQIDGVLNPDYELRKHDILTVRSNGNKQLIGRCILSGDVEGKISHSGFTIRIRITMRGIDPTFLVRFLKSEKIHRMLIESGDGANISSLNQRALTALPISFPSVARQREIVDGLDAMDAETSRLESLYRQKLAAVAELKQSILQKAFSGELTAETATKTVVPAAVAQSAQDRKQATAIVLALAFERHKRAHRDKTFGHVKAQKILHIVEAEADFDLGRTPIKDAAGPNDFAHMLEAEEWAEAHKYFRFPRQSDGGYQFVPMANYEQLLGAARLIDAAKRDKIERIIDLFIPMDKQQAELLATIYAAWNNLLLEGKSPTDEDIVGAAREDWHEKKMDIPRDKFFKTLRLLKDKDCKPAGRGRKVESPPQGSLFA